MFRRSKKISAINDEVVRIRTRFQKTGFLQKNDGEILFDYLIHLERNINMLLGNLPWWRRLLYRVGLL